MNFFKTFLTFFFMFLYKWASNDKKQGRKEQDDHQAVLLLQMVKLYENGKSRTGIVREQDLTASALDGWINNHQATGSFVAKDGRTEEENELDRLRKENQRLLIENDILK